MRSMCRVLIKKTSSVYDKNSQFACPAHANCFGTSSVSLVQRQRRCDGRTYRAETVEQWVDGGRRNEDAVVQQLEQSVCTAHTDNPVPGHASTCTPSSQACMWLDLPHRANAAQSGAGVSSRAWSYFFVPLTTRAAAFMTRCNLLVADFGDPANSRLQQSTMDVTKAWTSMAADSSSSDRRTRNHQKLVYDRLICSCEGRDTIIIRLKVM